MFLEHGYITLPREILTSFLWEDKPFSVGQAYIDLILLANYTDKRIMKDGKVQYFKRGTVNRSMLSLSERWGWDRKKTRRFLKCLEGEGLLHISGTTRGTSLFLANYGVFQGQGTTRGTTLSPTEGQLKDNSSPQRKKEKKGKKEEERERVTLNTYGEHKNVFLSPEDFRELREEYPESIIKEKIEGLSAYMMSTGKSYKNHAVTIRSWIEKDLKKTAPDTLMNTPETQAELSEMMDFLRQEQLEEVKRGEAT